MIEKDAIKSHVRGVSYFVKRFRVVRILWSWHYGSKLLKCCSGALVRAQAWEQRSQND